MKSGQHQFWSLNSVSNWVHTHTDTHTHTHTHTQAKEVKLTASQEHWGAPLEVDEASKSITWLPSNSDRWRPDSTTKTVGLDARWTPAIVTVRRDWRFNAVVVAGCEECQIRTRLITGYTIATQQTNTNNRTTRTTPIFVNKQHTKVWLSLYKCSSYFWDISTKIVQWIEFSERRRSRRQLPPLRTRLRDWGAV